MFTVASGDLAPTETYRVRSWAMVSNGSGFVAHDRLLPTGEVVTEHVPGLAKVSIRLQHRHRRYKPVPETFDAGECDEFAIPPPAYRAGKTPGVESDTYAIDAAEPRFPGCKAFTLLNLDDPGQKEPYLTHIGAVTNCTCRAGLCKVPTGCKHESFCVAADELGLFDAADFAPPPAPAARPQPAIPACLDDVSGSDALCPF